MLRSELQAATEKVVAVIEAVDLESTFRGIPKEGPEDIEMILGAFRMFIEASTDFSDADWALVDILGIRELFDEKWWGSLGSTDPTRTQINRMWRTTNFIVEILPAFINLLNRRGDGGVSEGQTQRLELLLLEDSTQRSRPARVAAAIESIDELYSVVADLHDLPPGSLALVACDSGSVMKFEFHGIAEAIEKVKELLLELWDRVAFHGHRAKQMDLKVVVESLSVIDEIEGRSGQGLEPETCEILKRKVIQGAEKFLEAGCTITEIETSSAPSPHELLRPAPKLLAPAYGIETEGPSVSDPPRMSGGGEEGLKPSEVDALRQLLDQQTGDSEPPLDPGQGDPTIAPDEEDIDV